MNGNQAARDGAVGSQAARTIRAGGDRVNEQRGAGPGRTIEQWFFYGARLLSQGGQALYLAALLLAAGSGESGPLGLSGVFAATLAASVIFGLPGGALADRLGPGRGFALGAVLRLGAIGVALAVASVHSGWLWTAAFVYSAGSQVFSAAEMALIPVVQRGASARAHALLIGLQYAGQGAGWLAMGVLLLLGGPHLALVAALVVYGVLVALTGALAVRLGRRGAIHAVHTRHAFHFGETFRFLRHEPRAAYAVGLLAFTDMAIKGAIIALPPFLMRDLDLGRVELGVLLGLGGLGAGVGLFWVVRMFSLRTAAHVMRLTLGGAIATLALLVLLGPLVGGVGGATSLEMVEGVGWSTHLGFIIALPAAFVLGVCFSLAPIGARAVLTDTAPPGQQARVFASQSTLAHAAVIPPLLLAGAATQLAGPRPVLACLGLVGLALMLLLERLTPRSGTAPAPVAAVPGDWPARGSARQ